MIGRVLINLQIGGSGFSPKHVSDHRLSGLTLVKSNYLLPILVVAIPDYATTISLQLPNLKLDLEQPILYAFNQLLSC